MFGNPVGFVQIKHILENIVVQNRESKSIGCISVSNFVCIRDLIMCGKAKCAVVDRCRTEKRVIVVSYRDEQKSEESILYLF